MVNDEKPDKLLILAIGGMALIFLVAVGYFVFFPPVTETATQPTPFIPEPTQAPQTKVELTGDEAPAIARMKEHFKVDRSDYRIAQEINLFDTFGYLPEIPEDFPIIAYQIHRGQLLDWDNVTREYFIQPEFFPLFIDNGLQFYQSYNSDYVGTFGWGVYPSVQNIETKQGTTGIAEFFFKTGWGVETYQGMNLKALSECDWIEPSVLNGEFLTPPTFPNFCTKELCGGDWARKIQVELKISENAPLNQECLVYLTNQVPSQEKQSNWAKKYSILYVNSSTSMVTAGIPLKLKVTVRETANV